MPRVHFESYRTGPGLQKHPRIKPRAGSEPDPSLGKWEGSYYIVTHFKRNLRFLMFWHLIWWVSYFFSCKIQSCMKWVALKIINTEITCVYIVMVYYSRNVFCFQNIKSLDINMKSLSTYLAAPKSELYNSIHYLYFFLL